MRFAPRFLINTPEMELWPGGLLRARANIDARALARARWVLRRKRDGRYLAAALPEGLLPLVPRLTHEPGIDAALDELEWLDGMQAHAATGPRARAAFEARASRPLPLDRLRERLHRLDLDESYGDRTGLPQVAEPGALAFAGFDRYRRALWLTASATRAWRAMRQAALADGVVLEAISGYRSHDYQLGIFERKLARGQRVQDILTVNAAPGYSEHHGGDALDIAAPGEPPAEESFEATPAFAWLQSRAGEFGFRMSYPRNNPHGVVYEPWHWRHAAAAQKS